MEMATILIWLMVGFVLLVKGADLFVEGSASAARLLRVPAAVIGLTVVAFGTSAPELAVSVTAALAGSNGIALGNVIGSNMFNLLMVTGLSSMAAAMPVDRGLMNWDFFFSIAVSVVMLAMTAFDRQMGRIDGAVMLALFAYFLYHVFQTAVRERRSAQKERRSLSAPLSAVYIAAGLGAVVLGSGMVVDCASALASAVGRSANHIGQSGGAPGAARPALGTRMVAARKGENGLALGNVIGSNIFNILLIMGVSSSVSPIQVTVSTVYDLICLILVSCVCWAMGRRKMCYTRAHGILMVGMYAVYMIYVLIRA